MSLPPLACPLCKCPLAPPSGQASGMNCPRCNTWLDLDPLCLGSCLACHKVNQDSPANCLEEPAASEAKDSCGQGAEGAAGALGRKRSHASGGAAGEAGIRSRAS